MTPINERPSPSDEHYTDMSSAGQSTGGYADETDDRPHYLSPRSALKGYYDAPRSGEESSMGSEYDNPSALFNAQVSETMCVSLCLIAFFMLKLCLM